MTNVLLIMADELSTWGLGCYGGPALTPNIDRLARRGLRFDAAYTPSPICVPTRAAIATGRYLHEIGYWDSAQAYDGRVPGWGHACQSAGIPCTSIGKLHYRNRTDPTGFDEQIEPIHILNGVGWVQAVLRQPVAPYTMAHELAEMIGPGETDYIRFDRRVTGAACDWLSNAPDRPWCTFVSFLSPHFPLIVPEEYYALYEPEPRDSEVDAIPDHPVLREIYEFFDHDRYFTPETRGIARAAYFGLCSFLDAQVGQVLAALEASGYADETLVIFTSDHGEMLGEKGFWTKSTMYESAARVPLTVTGPGITPGSIPSPVSLIDLAPTIAQTLDLDADYPGHTLLAPADPDRTIISEYHDGGCPVGITMVRWGDWKFVHYAQGHAPQLFHLAEDPREETDLAEARPAMLTEGRRRMREILDPEATDARAHASQLEIAERLGGREHLESLETFNFTPADSR